MPASGAGPCAEVLVVTEPQGQFISQAVIKQEMLSSSFRGIITKHLSTL